MLADDVESWSQAPICSNVHQGDVKQASSGRWTSEMHGHMRRGRIYLSPSPGRTWMHTHEIDSDFTLKRTLILSDDPHQGLMASYVDIAELRRGQPWGHR